MYLVIARWFGIRLDFLSNIIVIAVVFISIPLISLTGKLKGSKAKWGYSERWGYSVGSNIFKTPRAYELYFERYFLLYSRLYPPTLSSEA